MEKYTCCNKKSPVSYIFTVPQPFRHPNIKMPFNVMNVTHLGGCTPPRLPIDKHHIFLHLSLAHGGHDLSMHLFIYFQLCLF